jgi:hypothetical protein
MTATYTKIIEHLTNGGHVQICTYGASFVYGPTHINTFKLVNDQMYIKQGKRWALALGIKLRYSVI